MKKDGSYKSEIEYYYSSKKQKKDGSYKNEIEYYPSGNEWYVGEVLYKKGSDDVVNERLPNGNGTFYYDTPSHKIKYTGEFEEGLYDGSGTFYSTDGKMNVVSLNISNGIPTQKGKLNINFSKRKINNRTLFCISINSF